MAGIPETIYAGDSLSWTEVAGEYPAPEWTMRYAVRGASMLDLNSTPSGVDHAFLATAAQTAALSTGQYSWQSFVSDGTGSGTPPRPERLPSDRTFLRSLPGSTGGRTRRRC